MQLFQFETELTPSQNVVIELVYLRESYQDFKLVSLGSGSPTREKGNEARKEENNQPASFGPGM